MIITISRQAATNGGLLGRLAAARLGLRVYDRELVDEIARQMAVDPQIINHFDEVRLSPIQSLLWEWRASINEQIYVRYLRQALLAIQREGNALIIGRGANFVLQCPECLHVRIVAPMPLRVGIYRTAFPEVAEAEAKRRILAEDRDKRNVIRVLYHASIDDPLQYDLVINLAGLTPETTIEEIATAAAAREAVKLPVESRATLLRHMAIMTRHRRPAQPGMVERYQFIG